MSKIQFDVLTMLTALLLRWLTTYFRFGGSRYTIFVLTNQKLRNIPKLNDNNIPSTFILMN